MDIHHRRYSKLGVIRRRNAGTESRLRLVIKISFKRVAIERAVKHKLFQIGQIVCVLIYSKRERQKSDEEKTSHPTFADDAALNIIEQRPSVLSVPTASFPKIFVMLD